MLEILGAPLSSTVETTYIYNTHALINSEGVVAVILDDEWIVISVRYDDKDRGSAEFDVCAQ